MARYVVVASQSPARLMYDIQDHISELTSGITCRRARRHMRTLVQRRWSAVRVAASTCCTCSVASALCWPPSQRSTAVRVGLRTSCAAWALTAAPCLDRLGCIISLLTWLDHV